MIYITGDCHGDFRRFNAECFPEQKEMNREDTVIILGDFGGVWDYKGESSSEKYWLNWLEKKPYTTVFVDGNHEKMRRGKENLKKHGNQVDYLITHSPSASVLALPGFGTQKQDILTRYLEEIRQSIQYKRHFCGHLHMDRQVNEKDILLYEQIVRIA